MKYSDPNPNSAQKEALLSGGALKLTRLWSPMLSRQWWKNKCLTQQLHDNDEEIKLDIFCNILRSYVYQYILSSTCCPIRCVTQLFPFRLDSRNPNKTNVMLYSDADYQGIATIT